MVAACTTTPLLTPTSPPSPTASPSPTPTSSRNPIPTAPSTPSPTPSASPTASPAAAAFLVSAQDIGEHVAALDEIARDNGSTRASGTTGYDASVDYVADQLQEMGYRVMREQVDFTFFRETAPVTLAIGERTWTGTEWLHAMVYSAGGNVSGDVHSVGIQSGRPTETAACDPADWDDFEPGGIAIVFGGGCLRRDIVSLAQQAGATAVISMYPDWAANQTRQPTLLDPSGIDIPVLAVGREPTLALLEAAQAGAVAQLSVEVEASAATAENVIGEITGISSSVVMLGGHLDSVLDGPGINDNGSGVATLLAIAEAFSRQPQASDTVRFAFWAVEELGTHGSQHYVEQLSSAERQAIEGYINLDMVGSPNSVRYVYADDFAAPGSAEISQSLLDALSASGHPGLGVTSGGSDHIPFVQAGVPTGGLFSGIAPLGEEEAELFGGQAGVPADACYHLACDAAANVDVGNAQIMGQAVADMLEELAY